MDALRDFVPLSSLLDFVKSLDEETPPVSVQELNPWRLTQTVIAVYPDGSCALYATPNDGREIFRIPMSRETAVGLKEVLEVLPEGNL